MNDDSKKEEKNIYKKRKERVFSNLLLVRACVLRGAHEKWVPKIFGPAGPN